MGLSWVPSPHHRLPEVAPTLKVVSTSSTRNTRPTFAHPQSEHSWRNELMVVLGHSMTCFLPIH